MPNRVRNFRLSGGIAASCLYAMWTAGGLGAQQGALPAPVTFLPPVAFETGEYGPGDVERADLNNDGLTDLAVFTTGNGAGVQFLLGDGNSRLLKDNTLGVGYGSGIASGDFNNDGKRDLVVTQAAASGVTRYTDLYCDPVSPAADYPAAIVFLGVAGASPFPSPPGAPLTPSACLHAANSSVGLTDAVAGHFDNDGFLDLAEGSSNSGLRVYRGNGDGTFMAPVQAVFPGYGSTSAKPYLGSPMTAVDLDVDGHLDVVADMGGSPAILRNTGDGTVAHPWGQLTYYRTSGAGSASPGLPYQGALRVFNIGDFNGDGTPDIAGVQSGSTSPAGLIEYIVYVSLGTRNIGNGLLDPGEDFNGNGVLDINEDSARFQADTNPQQSFPGPGPVNQFGGMALTDFNRDGSLDLAAVHRAGNAVVVYRGYGNGALTAGTTVTVGNQPRFAIAGDWNGDNLPDLAIVDHGSEGGVNSFTYVLTQTVAIEVAPAITIGPASQTILSGQTATLSVVATGTAPLSYQWYQGASPSTTTPIAGATGSTFTTPPLTTTASYWVRVANGFPPAADSATATVAVSTCEDTLTLSYVAGTLNIGFRIGTRVPANWNVWLFAQNTLYALWSTPLPAVSPAVSFNVPIPGFPHIGTVYVITTLGPGTQTTCWDVKNIGTN